MIFPISHPSTKQLNEKYDHLLKLDFFNPFLPFSQEPIGHLPILAAIKSECKEIKLFVSEICSLPVTIKNNSSTAWSSLPPTPVNISYHWINLSENDHHQHDGLRTHLTDHHCIDVGGLSIPEYLFLLPGEEREYSVNVLAPSYPGYYQLSITLVQEGHFWFDNLSEKNVLHIAVEILANEREHVTMS